VAAISNTSYADEGEGMLAPLFVAGTCGAGGIMREYDIMEFAIITTGGKQYSVAKGDVISIERLAGEHKEGDKVTFDKVLLWDNGSDTTIGTPYIPRAAVKGTITQIGRAPKIIVTHYKQKSRYWKRNGHRQGFFKIKIDALK